MSCSLEHGLSDSPLLSAGASRVSAESEGFIPLIPYHGRVSVESEGFIPLIPYHGRVSAESEGFIPLIPYHGRVSAESEGFIPLISYSGRVSAESEGFIPLISYHGRVSAESEGFIPLIPYHGRSLAGAPLQLQSPPHLSRRESLYIQLQPKQPVSGMSETGCSGCSSIPGFLQNPPTGTGRLPSACRLPAPA